MTGLSYFFFGLTALCFFKGMSESRIVFPDDNPPYRESKELPLAVEKKWNQVTDMEEFLGKFVERDRRSSVPALEEKIQTAKMASCMPELQVVSLKPATDNNSIYIPSSTRVKRCGGCCLHDLLSCQPVEIETLRLGVVITEHLEGKLFANRRNAVVSVEQHTKCKCDCHIKETDCSPYHIYDINSCRCSCPNYKEMDKCQDENKMKVWDLSRCACLCREEMPCSTNFHFDQQTCRCVKTLQ